MQALHREGSVPVPEVLWFEEDPSILGARFVCMGRVEGDVPADNPGTTARAGCWPSTSGQRRVWESGIDTMAAIHQLDRAAVGLGWIAEVTLRAAPLDQEYRTFACGEAHYPVVDRAFALLAASILTSPDHPALCWGDSGSAT